MAETVFREQAAARGLSALVEVDSAGIAADTGFDMDRRARRALERHGYRPLTHDARQFHPAWLEGRDLVVVMDRGHIRWLERHGAGAPSHARVRLLLSYLPESASFVRQEIADPYFGHDNDFESCLEQIEAGCTALWDELAPLLAPGKPLRD